jgi:hypothetical protein
MKHFLPSRSLLVSIFLSSSLLFSTTGFSQVAREWERIFDDRPNSWNRATAVVTDDVGNAYVTGESAENDTWDIVTIKYNSLGTAEWSDRYDGFHGIDYPTDMAIDKAGNIYITGGSEGDGTLNDVVTIKYSNTGVRQWVARYNGPGNPAEHAFGRNSIKVDNNGNVYVMGMTSTENNMQDYLTIKYNSQGVQQWVQYYNGPGDDFDWPFAMALEPVTGDVYITGFTQLVNSSAYATVKYNSAGVQQWARTYHEPTKVGQARAIALDAQGNVCVTGYNTLGFVTSCVTIKYDASGVQQWTASYTQGNASCVPLAMAIDKFGNIYITGSGYFTLKYNNEGVQQWVQTQNDNAPGSYAEGRSLALDDEGNVYVTGYTDSAGAHLNRNYITIKYNPAGVQQWVQRYDAFGSNDEPFDIAVNKFNDVFVIGTIEGGGSPARINYHYLTVKYVQPEPLIVTASPDTTVYYGYGSNCVQLKADASGGIPPYTFTWLPGGNTPTKVSTTVCPTATTVYKVIVKDAIGSSDTAQLTVKVIDVRCGDKVIVCHNGKELCIASPAVAAHLQHGDKLGSCTSGTNDCDKLKDLYGYKGKFPFIFKAYPNPFGHVSTLVYQLPVDAQVTITVIDVNGREIKTLVREKKRAGYYLAFIDGRKLTPGTYVCKMVISAPPCQSVYTLKLIVVK